MQEAVQNVTPSMSKVSESPMSSEPEPDILPREALIIAPRSQYMGSESTVKTLGLEGQQSVATDPPTELWREFIEQAKAPSGNTAVLLE